MTASAPIDRRRIVAALAIVLAVPMLYWPSIPPLLEAWGDTERLTYTHGYLVAAISAWLLWRARAGLAEREPAPNAAALAARIVLLLALALAWQIAYRAGIQIAQQVLLPPLIWTAIYALLGTRAARAAFLPLAYLYFAIPVWDYLNFAALWSTTYAVRAMLTVAGVPAFFEGNSVQVPAGQFEIAGGCSGMHYIVVALALAVFIGELRRDRWPVRLRWLAIALGLAVVCNWIRVFVVILAGHLTHMQHYLVRESHYGFGWVLFAAVILALIVIDRRTPLAPARAPAEPADPLARAPSADSFAARTPVKVSMVAIALAMPLLLNRLIESRTAETGMGTLAANSGCTPAGDALQWQPQQHAADAEARQAYLCDGRRVELYAAWYRDQYQGKKLGGYDNRLHGDADVLTSAVEVAGGRSFVSLQVRRDGRDELLWLTWRVADRDFTSATRAQLWYSLRTLQDLRSPVSVAFAARAACEPDCATARDTLSRFLKPGGIP